MPASLLTLALYLLQITCLSLAHLRNPALFAPMRGSSCFPLLRLAFFHKLLVSGCMQVNTTGVADKPVLIRNCQYEIKTGLSRSMKTELSCLAVFKQVIAGLLLYGSKEKNIMIYIL